MWPWAHAAFGYLCYTGVLGLRRGGQPTGWPVLALVLGTQVPDLVDKPLAWYVHVLPYGRSLAHSLLIAVPVLLVVTWYADRRDQSAVAVAFGVGYLSHLVGDALHPVVGGQWRDAGFLAWPLVAPPAHEVEGLHAHVAGIKESSFFLFGLAVTLLGLLTWQSHGRPGLAELRSVAAGVTNRLAPR